MIGLLGDPAQLEQDAGDVDVARHRLREPEQVGRADRLEIVGLELRDSSGVDLVFDRDDLDVELRGVQNAEGEQEPAGRGEDQRDPDANSGRDDQRHLAAGHDHDVAPGARTSALIVNVIT